LSLSKLVFKAELSNFIGLGPDLIHVLGLGDSRLGCGHGLFIADLDLRLMDLVRGLGLEVYGLGTWTWT